MARLATLALALGGIASTVAAFGSSSYFVVLELPTTTRTYPVSPTASVSPTSSSAVSTRSEGEGYVFTVEYPGALAPGPGEYNWIYSYTVTNFYLPSTAPVCWEITPAFSMSTSLPECPQTYYYATTSSTSTPSTLTTRVFAPMVVTPPAQCDKTSFSYTTSKQLTIDGDSGFTSQAAASAMLVTTYVVSATTYVDVFLSAGAVGGLDAATADPESYFLHTCQDPSSALCGSGTPKTPGGCLLGTGPIVYPPTAIAKADGVTGTSSSTSPTGPAGKNGAGGPLRANGALFVGAAMMGLLVLL